MATKTHYKAVWGSCKVGVVASNFCEFIAKCKKRFNLQDSCSLILSLEDQTEVDEEFFSLVECGETLILSIPDTCSDVPQDKQSLLSSSLQRNLFLELHKFLQQCIEAQPNLSSNLQDLLGCDNLEGFQERIAALPLCSEKAASSGREDHPDWFKGLSSGQHSKEQVLRGSAECRMRGYFQHLQRDLRSQLKADQGDGGCRAEQDSGSEEDWATDQDCKDRGTSSTHQLHNKVEAILTYFRNELKRNRFNQSYFDRTAPAPQLRLCDPSGRFCCGGPYNRPRCDALHSINPYASRELRIVFSTWNLDHMIEKSRSVIPTLKKLICTQPVSAINQPYFYDLLFTKHDGINHVCHKNNINSIGNNKSLASSQLQFHSGVLSSGLGNPNTLKGGVSADESDGNACRKKQKREGFELSVSLVSPSASFPSPVTPICGGSSSLVPNSRGTPNAIPLPCTLASQTPVPAKITVNTCNNESKPGDKLKGVTPINVISSSCKIVPSMASLQSREDSQTPYQLLGGQISDLSCSNASVVGSLEPKQRAWDGNLKLVHIACHVKLPHCDMKCNPACILLPKEETKVKTQQLDTHQKKVSGMNQSCQSSASTAVSRKKRGDIAVKEVRTLRNRQKRDSQMDKTESNIDLHDGMASSSVSGTKGLEAYVLLSRSVDIDSLAVDKSSSGSTSSLTGQPPGTRWNICLSPSSSPKKPRRNISKRASVWDSKRSNGCLQETSSDVSSISIRKCRSKRQLVTSNSKNKRSRR